MEEAFEEQVVLDRIDPGDPEQVGHDAVRRRPPPLAGNAAGSCEAHQVPIDQEELRKAGLVDDVELLLQAGGHFGRYRVIFLTNRVLAEAIQEGIWCFAGRHGEAWEAGADQVESEAAALGDLRGVGHALLDYLPGIAAEDLPELCARFEVMLRIRLQIALRLIERGSMANGRKDIVQSVTIGSGVQDLIGDDEWRVMLLGKVDPCLVFRTVIWCKVIVQLDEDPVPSENLLVERQPVFWIGDEGDQVAAERDHLLTPRSGQLADR